MDADEQYRFVLADAEPSTQGFDVPLTCLNRSLADHLRKALGDEPRIRVYGFHALTPTARRSRSLGPEGPAPPGTQQQELSSVLHRLIEEGDLEAKNVVVLTPHTPAHSLVFGQFGAIKVTDDPVS
jgi:hypothetical protein